jgi:hypothetical protein
MALEARTNRVLINMPKVDACCQAHLSGLGCDPVVFGIANFCSMQFVSEKIQDVIVQ